MIRDNMSTDSLARIGERCADVGEQLLILVGVITMGLSIFVSPLIIGYCGPPGTASRCGYVPMHMHVLVIAILGIPLFLFIGGGLLQEAAEKWSNSENQAS